VRQPRQWRCGPGCGFCGAWRACILRRPTDGRSCGRSPRVLLPVKYAGAGLAARYSAVGEGWLQGGVCTRGHASEGRGRGGRAGAACVHGATGAAAAASLRACAWPHTVPAEADTRSTYAPRAWTSVRH